jgi:hypothetical protein
VYQDTNFDSAKVQHDVLAMRASPSVIDQLVAPAERQERRRQTERHPIAQLHRGRRRARQHQEPDDHERGERVVDRFAVVRTPSATPAAMAPPRVTHSQPGTRSSGGTGLSCIRAIIE